MAKRKSKDVGKRQRFYGFVDSRIEADESNYSRETLLLDCIDADKFDADPKSISDPESLALIRTLSTPRRWVEDFNLDRGIEETDWLELVVQVDPGSPRAWVMPYSSGYISEKPQNIRAIAKLPSEGQAGASAEAAKIAKQLQDTCKLAPSEIHIAHGPMPGELWDIDLTNRVDLVSIDVGQASCNMLMIDNKVVGYFDVGAPLYRNQKSWNNKIGHGVPTSGFVILSHWDFDHFDLGRRIPNLQKLKWYAPIQPVGPNTLRFQRSLGSQLIFMEGYQHLTPHMDLYQGTCSNPKNRNGTGYAARLIFGDNVALITGDMDYHFMNPEALQALTALTLPHHGGACSAPPKASGLLSRAVASYGLPNCYRHPNEECIENHKEAGWTILRTAAHQSNHKRRGHRRLLCVLPA